MKKQIYHYHHVQEGLGLIPVPCILKIKLVLPSLPRSSYVSSSFWFKQIYHHHHVQEGLDLIPIPWILKMKLSLHLFLGRPMCLRPFGLNKFIIIIMFRKD